MALVEAEKELKIFGPWGETASSLCIFNLKFNKKRLATNSGTQRWIAQPGFPTDQTINLLERGVFNIVNTSVLPPDDLAKIVPIKLVDYVK